MGIYDVEISNNLSYIRQEFVTLNQTLKDMAKLQLQHNKIMVMILEQQVKGGE